MDYDKYDDIDISRILVRLLQLKNCYPTIYESMHLEGGASFEIVDELLDAIVTMGILYDEIELKGEMKFGVL